MANEDLYSFFGVSHDATADEIKERYRFLCHAYHPDKFSTEAQRHLAEQEFKRINEVYQILSDPAKRAQHDESRGMSSNASSSQESFHSIRTDFSANLPKKPWKRRLTRFYVVGVVIWFCYWIIYVPFYELLKMRELASIDGPNRQIFKEYANLAYCYREISSEFIQSPGLTVVIFVVLPLIGYGILWLLCAIGVWVLNGSRTK